MPSAYADKRVPSKSSQFELPALKLDFGNITDGTNIPPPPDSPVRQPTVPILEAKGVNKENGSATDTNGQAQLLASQNGKLAGNKRSADEVPLSPSLQSRPGTLRRFLSKTMLNNSYAEGQSSGNNVVERPVSRSGSSFMGISRPRRSSGWFRRLRGGDSSSRRSSILFEENGSSLQKSFGPPPPMIPELRELEKDEGSLGPDLFKNIK